MSSNPELQSSFFATLSALLSVPQEQLNAQSSRHTLPAWDSLKHMHLMLALEEKFGIEFDDAELAELGSAQAILDALALKLAP